MAVTLSKGQNVSLSKTDPALKHILIGLGWDARSSDGQPFDLDASLFMTGDNKKVPSDAYFIFYNQLKSPEGAVEHTGDNLTILLFTAGILIAGALTLIIGVRLRKDWQV